MATEAPLIRDGAQCVAGANLWNPASALFGFGGSAQYLAVKLSAVADRTVLLVAASTDDVYGILQNTPALGQAADVGLWGVSKAVAGAAVTRGARLMIDTNGRVITWVSGATNTFVGFALESAAAANAVITVTINCPSKGVWT
jgi:hypothetical protein